MRPSRAGLAALAATALLSAVCTRPEAVAPGPSAPLAAGGVTAIDGAPREPLRMVPVEAYVRSYLQVFGGLAPVEMQARVRGADGSLLFDGWEDYLSALGLPDYRADIPRAAQTNAIMLATFERLGAALCARALEHDWKGAPAVPVKERLVFAFDPGKEAPSPERFAEGFDVLHRTFLGYPAALAPTDRAPRFRRLFDAVRDRHAAPGAPATRLDPLETAWVAVCEGLVRHPELHLY